MEQARGSRPDHLPVSRSERPEVREINLHYRMAVRGSQKFGLMRCRILHLGIWTGKGGWQAGQT
eukprot:1138252-Pelagomonas_calceolata.AAC.2